METEEQIVYSIIETVKKGTLSDDSKVDERVIRGFLKIYRASALAKHAMDGVAITDESFQHLGLLRFTKTGNKQFSRELPKMIRLRNNYGMFFEKDGDTIPVLASEEFSLSLKTFLGKHIPKAKMMGSKAVVYVGQNLIDHLGEKAIKNTAVNYFIQDLIESNGASIEIDVHAVLDDPDHCPYYDWTTSAYPCPSELIEDIKTKILGKEFNLILQLKTDKTNNGNDEESVGQQKSNT